jgi:hypothetical protein
MLLLSAKACALSSSDISWFVFELVLVIIALKKKLFTSKNLNVLFLLAISYLGLILFRNLFNKLSDEYLVSDLTFFVKFIFTAFLYGLVLQEKAIPYIIKVIYHLAIISLIFYPIQLADSQLVNDIGKVIDLTGLGSHNLVGGYNNYLFFTIYDRHITRNCGFSWEPGAYACILSVALIFSFLSNNLKFKKETYVIIIALITTISTTGYIMLLILVILKGLNSGNYKLKFIYLLPILLIVAIVFINSPILYKKVQSAYTTDINNSSNYDDLQNFYGQENKTIPLNRFASMIQIVLAFKYQLILGVSNKYDVTLAKKYNFNISNGIADFLARLGVMGFLLYLRNYLKFAARYVKSKSSLIVIAVFFLVLFIGEPLLSTPLFFFFAIYPLIWPQVNVRKEQIIQPVVSKAF